MNSGKVCTKSSGKHSVLLNAESSLGYSKRIAEDFPGIQWFRIPLSTQGTRAGSLVQEDTTGHGTTKPVHHNYSRSWV